MASISTSPPRGRPATAAGRAREYRNSEPNVHELRSQVRAGRCKYGARGFSSCVTSCPTRARPLERRTEAGARRGILGEILGINLVHLGLRQERERIESAHIHEAQMISQPPAHGRLIVQRSDCCGLHAAAAAATAAALAAQLVNARSCPWSTGKRSSGSRAHMLPAKHRLTGHCQHSLVNSACHAPAAPQPRSAKCQWRCWRGVCPHLEHVVHGGSACLNHGGEVLESLLRLALDALGHHSLLKQQSKAQTRRPAQ